MEREGQRRKEVNKEVVVVVEARAVEEAKAVEGQRETFELLHN